MSMLDSAYL